MAKKDLNEDILSGGSISDSANDDKSAKKAESKAKSAEKKAKKTAEKRQRLEDEIKDLRAKLNEATDEEGDNTDIILICADRRAKSDEMLVKIFGLGIAFIIIYRILAMSSVDC